MRSNVGRNLSYIQRETGLNPWLFGTARVKAELKARYKSVIPNGDVWRLGCLEKLLTEKVHAYYDADREAENDINLLIQSLVST